MTVLLVAILFVVIGTIAYIALRNAQDFSDANEVVPGVRTNAPKEWAGAHSHEARLHRRLRDAVSAMRANHQLDALDLADIRASVEREALAIDDRLVAIARLSGRRRSEEFGPIEDAVAALEDLVADIVLMRGPGSDPAIGIQRIRDRLSMVQEARAELAGLSDDFEQLRRQLEQQTDADAGAAADADAGADANGHRTGDDAGGELDAPEPDEGIDGQDDAAQ